MKNTILLTEYLEVERDDLERLGVYETILGVDTNLYVDPKLLDDVDIPEFKNSREKVINYFGQFIKILKSSHINAIPRLEEKARAMIAVEEPRGLSIGTGSETDRGQAISNNIARAICVSATELMLLNIEDEELVELLGLFVSGFGKDSISDLVVHIIYEDFCKFTERIAGELDIDSSKLYELKIGGKVFTLPKHPFLEGPVIFVPNSLVRVMPIATSWNEIIDAAEENEELRSDFNDMIAEEVKKNMVNPSELDEDERRELRDNFKALISVYRLAEIGPYDSSLDWRGYYGVVPFAKEQRKNSYKTKVVTPGDRGGLIKSIREFVDERFRRSIEQNGGYKVLYRKDDNGKTLYNKPHREDVVQLLFYLLADFHCSLVNVALSSESYAGLGYVDFTFAKGYEEKIVLEIKKSDSPSLIDNYEKQVKAYADSENAFHSFFVVIDIDNRKGDDGVKSNLEILKERHETDTEEGKDVPELIVVDATEQTSPSKR